MISSFFFFCTTVYFAIMARIGGCLFSYNFLPKGSGSDAVFSKIFLFSVEKVGYSSVAFGTPE